MKKHTLLYICSLLIIVASSIMPTYAQQSKGQYALYNYRNDGDFNAWLNIDVDSITYSCIDTLGIEHDDVVVQEVWTHDSCYRIPIEAIDSIGFRAPDPVYQDNVFHITTEYISYITAIDSLTITFSSSLPVLMRPIVGQVVTSDTFEEPLTDGFAGKVSEIIDDGEHITIVCEGVNVTDVFKKLIIVGKAVAVDEKEAKSRPLHKLRKTWGDYEDSGDVEFEFPGKISVKINDFISIEDEVSMTADYYVYVDLPRFKVRATATGIHNLKTSWSIDSEKILKWMGYETEKFEPEWATPVWPVFNIPGVFNFGIRAGAFLAPSAKLSLTGSTPLTFTHTFGFEISNTDTYVFLPLVLPIVNASSELGTPEISLSLEGKLFAGIALGVKATVIGDKVLSADITGRFGPEFDAKIQMKQVLGEDDPVSWYSLLKDSKLGVQLKADAKVKAKVFGENMTENLSWDWKWPIPGWEETRYLFPDFTKPELPHYLMPDPLDMRTTPHRDIIMPIYAGLGIYDEEGTLLRAQYSGEKYRTDAYYQRPPHVFIGDLPAGQKYTCQPIFNFPGLPGIGEIKALPLTEFTVPYPVNFGHDLERTIKKGENRSETIYGGWGFYEVESDNPNVAKASIHQNEGVLPYVIIEGLADGKATIKITDMYSGDEVTLPITVTNEPIPQTTISVSHTEIDFGTVSQGGTMKKRFKVTNDGESSITIQASCESSDFELSDNNTKVTLAKGESKDYIVTCNGLSITDDVNAVIIITSDGSSESQCITLKAKCGSATTSNIAVSPTEIDFGSVEYGTTKTRELKVSNTGDKSLTFHVSYQGSKTIFVSDNGKEYTLNPGDYKIYTVTCQGMLQDVNATGEIKVVTTADNGNQIVKLTAQGAAPTTFTLEKNSTEIKAGSVGYVNILYGSNNYSISNGNNEVVSVVIDTDNGDYGRVKLVGIDPGQSMVKLTDQKTKKTVNLSVVVKEDDSPYITFVDAEVEKVCLSHWDANGDGRLSKTEAAAVKDLNGAFMYNYDIYSFPEFRYFTGIDILNLDFYNCHQLQDIVLPVNLKNIYWNTFYDCGKLRSIHIPQNVSYINNLAFQWSNGLETVTVSTKNVKYDSRENCNAIIESETNTLNNGFYTTIVPPTVTAIGSNAFWGQDRLEELSLPSSITEIGEGAFGFCDLREVTIPSSVVNIGGGLFGGCYNLKSITVAPGNSVYDSREGSNAIINSHTNELMQGCQNTTIPSSVTSIAAYAFQWQYRLKNITIPEGVKSIGRYAFYNCDELDNIYIPASVSYIGSGAFGCCTDLSEVVVSSQNPTYDSRNQSNAIVETATNTLMHANRYTLISDDITSVADDALAGYNAYSLTLPEGITYIGNQAFRGCRLESLKLPSTLKDLGSAVFWECEDLTDVVCYAKDVPYVDGFDHGDWTFHVSNATLHVPAGSVDSYRNAPYWQDFGNIVALPKSTIKVEPIENDFGTVPNGKSKTMYFTVTNTGEEIVFFHLDFNNNDMFEVSDVGTEYLLKAGESKSFTITCYGLKAGTSASVRVSIESDALNATDFSVVDIFANGEPISYTPSQPVDLGLPSGTLWASYNLGASAPEDFGYYYAWGETEERSVYSEENYLYKGQDIGSDISGTAYDVVTQKWGNGWQMPTSAQFSELEDKCTWEWTTQNGINGQKVTGPNGNSIFLPAVGSGYYDGEGVGSTGYYWTSTVYDSTLAYDFIYYMDFLSYVGKHDRYNAHAVRPVMSIQVKKEISVTPTEIDFGTMTEGTSETEYITVSNVGSGTINFHFDYTSDFITVSGGDKENIVLEARQSHTFPVVCTIPKNCQSLGESVTIYIRSDADNEKEVAVKASVTIKPGSDTELDALMKELVNDMVTVEGGTFTMGATDGSGYEDERPTHQVTLSTYKICRYEVTQKLWTAIMGNNPSTFIDDDLPVNNVSWDECQTFISKLNELAYDYCNDLFCLPTEAQWEYAARGGVQRNDLSGDYGYQYAGGYNYIEEMDSYVWYSDNSNETIHPVGTKKPNELGLYDMSGNVCEYVKDYFSWNTYTEEAQQNPTGAESGDSRVYRGGSYDRPSWQCRLASRFGNEPDNKRVECGLRLASDVGEDYIGVGDGTTGGKQDDWKDGDPVIAGPGDETISVSGSGEDL